MSLAALQKSLISVLTDKTKLPVDMEQQLLPAGDLDVSSSLDIYKNNIKLNLTDNLLEIYKNTDKLTGRDFFTAMAKCYIKQSQSSFISINEYGRDFADFIHNYEPTRVLPYLSDVAKFEWALHWAKNCNSPIEYVNSSELAQTSADNIIFSKQKNSTLVSSKYKAEAIIKWCNNNGKATFSSDITEEIPEKYLYVWRCHDNVAIDSLSKSEYVFLSLLDGKTFDRVTAELVNDYGWSDITKVLLPLVEKNYIYAIYI